MKKFLSIIVLSLCSFFLFGFKVSALDVNINFDNHDHFNFFYEMKEDTPFYRFLIGQGESLEHTLWDYYHPNTTSFENIYIYYVSDIIGYNELVNSEYTVNYDLSSDNNFQISSNAYYVFVVKGCDNPNYFSFDSPNFYVYQGHQTCSSSNYWFGNIYYFYDINGNFINYYHGAIRYYDYYVFNNNYMTINTFEYFLSLFYYNDNQFYYTGSSTPSIRVKNIIIDDTEYILSSDNWFTNIWHSIVSFFTGAEYMSDSGYGLEYFRKDYAVELNHGYKGLINVLSLTDDNVSVPGNYQSKSFSLTDELHLYPLTSCSVDDIALYVRANSDEKFSIYLNGVNSNDEMSYQSSYYSSYMPVVNRFMKINPLRVYNIDRSLVNLTVDDFTSYIYRLSRGNNFDVYTVYYNPNCYSSVYVGESLEWTNPNSSNTITVSPDYDNWTDPENIVAGNSENFVFDTINPSNIFEKAWNGAKNFVSAAETIVSLSFTLFTEMPPEMQALLYTFFVIGVILLFLKIFR